MDDKLAKKMNKLEKILPGVFVDGVKSQNSEDLKKTILSAAMKVEEVAEQRAADKELVDLREKSKLLSSGYNEVAKVERAKIQYARQILRDRGIE